MVWFNRTRLGHVRLYFTKLLSPPLILMGLWDSHAAYTKCFLILFSMEDSQRCLVLIFTCQLQKYTGTHSMCYKKLASAAISSYQHWQTSRLVSTLAVFQWKIELVSVWWGLLKNSQDPLNTRLFFISTISFPHLGLLKHTIFRQI